MLTTHHTAHSTQHRCICSSLREMYLLCGAGVTLLCAAGVGRMLKVLAACQDPTTVEHLARALANGACQNCSFSAALRDAGGIAVLADTMAAPSNSLEETQRHLAWSLGNLAYEPLNATAIGETAAVSATAAAAVSTIAAAAVSAIAVSTIAVSAAV